MAYSLSWEEQADPGLGLEVATWPLLPACSGKEKRVYYSRSANISYDYPAGYYEPEDDVNAPYSCTVLGPSSIADHEFQCDSILNGTDTGKRCERSDRD